MISEDFQVGDPVWAKMKGYPPWPAKIVDPPPDAKISKNKKTHFVYFFGSGDYAWILDEHISPHTESMLNTSSKKKIPSYQSAIEELTSYSKTCKKEPHKIKMDNSDKKFPIKIEKIVNTSPRKLERKVLFTSPKMKRKRSLNDSSNEKKYKFLPADVSELENAPYFDPEINKLRKGLKNILPSRLKFGFIGLGMMGGNIVEKLLETGHNVFIWNRSAHKYNKYIHKGARAVNSVADLIAECDITFCCVSDPLASKEIVFSERGVLAGLSNSNSERPKGYVEMSSIDVDTSLAIGEVIKSNGGAYLEAPFYSTSKDAELGSLLILASGDRKLFEDCNSCFRAIGKHACYISCDVGKGMKMHLILHMFSGAVYGALGETFCLAERLGLQMDRFVEILSRGDLASEDLIEKAKNMLRRQFDVVTPLKYMEKDINFCLSMGDGRSNIEGETDEVVSLQVIAAANESYKRAKLRSFSNLDVSAIYKIAKHIV